MTKYYPITEEELYQIKNDCAYPNKEGCEGCEYNDLMEGCTWGGADIVTDKVLARECVER